MNALFGTPCTKEYKKLTPKRNEKSLLSYKIEITFDENFTLSYGRSRNCSIDYEQMNPFCDRMAY